MVKYAINLKKCNRKRARKRATSCIEVKVMPPKLLELLITSKRRFGMCFSCLSTFQLQHWAGLNTVCLHCQGAVAPLKPIDQEQIPERTGMARKTLHLSSSIIWMLSRPSEGYFIYTGSH